MKITTLHMLVFALVAATVIIYSQWELNELFTGGKVGGSAATSHSWTSHPIAAKPAADLSPTQRAPDFLPPPRPPQQAGGVNQAVESSSSNAPKDHSGETSGSDDSNGRASGSSKHSGAANSAVESSASTGSGADQANQVLRNISYWRQPPQLDLSFLRSLFPPEHDKFIFYEIDPGGFNNIRMSFEYVLMMTVVTGRTLVLPPRKGWYLIDYGPMKREGTKGGTTHFDDFFDMNDLKKVVPILSAEEFVQRFHKDPVWAIPSEFVGKKALDYGRYVAWAQRHSTKVPWNPLQVVVNVPSIKAVTETRTGRHALHPDFQGGRKDVEFSTEMANARALNFAASVRYLGQVGAAIKFAEPRSVVKARSLFLFLRNHFHYHDEIFRVAARIVAFLGLFGFSSMHVRRNELQYREVFIDSTKMHRNVHRLFKPREPLYIATDETTGGFFAEFEKHHKVYHWKDFFTPKGGSVLQGHSFSQKVIGQIEQVVCACGRVFVGTKYSTYTGYIPRLRGYLGAPDTNTYFATSSYNGDPAHDKGVDTIEHIRGTWYFRYFSSMWKDLDVH